MPVPAPRRPRLPRSSGRRGAGRRGAGPRPGDGVGPGLAREHPRTAARAAGRGRPGRRGGRRSSRARRAVGFDVLEVMVPEEPVRAEQPDRSDGRLASGQQARPCEQAGDPMPLGVVSEVEELSRAAARGPVRRDLPPRSVRPCPAPTGLGPDTAVRGANALELTRRRGPSTVTLRDRHSEVRGALRHPIHLP